MGSDLILYQFSRCQVERGDFGHFLSLYLPDNLPNARRLRAMMNSMVFSVSGWEAELWEIPAIPEVRRFYRAFHQVWPFWLYFCSLKMDNLKTMVVCCLPSVNTLQVDGKTRVAVTCDTRAILNFLKQDFPPMNRMCERAEMLEERMYDRTKAVFEYFGLPFDVPCFKPRA